MCRSQCLLAVLALSTVFFSTVKSWDIAITTGSQIEFYANGNKTNDQGVKSTGLTALAYDAVHNMLLYVDKQSDNASIFRYDLATNIVQALVGRKSYEVIQGIAFDPVSSKVFWIDEGEKGIYWKSLKSKDIYGQKLDINLEDQVPKAIAVDSCRGFLYWSNINISHPTIERVRIDGSDRKVIINTDIYLPMSITIDQNTKKIFWVDDREGIHYSIESSDLLGNNRKTINRGIHHSPRAIAVSKNNLYWIDAGYRALWKIPKTATVDSKKEPMLVFEFLEPMEPFGIVANYTIEDQTDGIEECAILRNISRNKTILTDPEGIPGDAGVFCLHGKKVEGKRQCECKLGYTGERCEIPVCINYCLEGECSLTNDGQPKCRCKEGYTGARCEINMCHDLCMNNAQCIIKDEKASCRCSGEYTGDRCEVKKAVVTRTAEENQSCNCTTRSNVPIASETLLASDGEFVETCNSGWDPLRDPIMMVLGTLCGLLCVACTLLITKVMQLKKRPRIKKRIIVQKNSTPLTARPDQCEITIENCCNMNICETPCFEPRSTIRPNLLDAKPGKEEKKNLINNMELPDDY